MKRLDLNSLRITALASLGALAACGQTGASHARVVDGTRDINFATDLGACRGLSRRQPVVDDETGNAVLADDKGDASEGAVVGALAGALADTQNLPGHRKAMVIACMRGRGHNVVG